MSPSCCVLSACTVDEKIAGPIRIKTAQITPIEYLFIIIVSCYHATCSQFQFKYFTQGTSHFTFFIPLTKRIKTVHRIFGIPHWLHNTDVGHITQFSPTGVRAGTKWLPSKNLLKNR